MEYQSCQSILTKKSYPLQNSSLSYSIWSIFVRFGPFRPILVHFQGTSGLVLFEEYNPNGIPIMPKHFDKRNHILYKIHCFPPQFGPFFSVLVLSGQFWSSFGVLPSQLYLKNIIQMEYQSCKSILTKKIILFTKFIVFFFNLVHFGPFLTFFWSISGHLYGYFRFTCSQTMLITYINHNQNIFIKILINFLGMTMIVMDFQNLHLNICKIFFFELKFFKNFHTQPPQFYILSHFKHLKRNLHGGLSPLAQSQPIWQAFKSSVGWF